MAQDIERPIKGTHAGVKTILLVEDDANIGEVLVEAITQETSFFAILVPDGREALNIVKGVRPSLFVLDYQLPYMNGIELYDQLHAQEALTNIPALMMSARLPHKELEKRQIPGMNKPIDLDEFLQAIEELIV